MTPETKKYLLSRTLLKTIIIFLLLMLVVSCNNYQQKVIIQDDLIQPQGINQLQKSSAFTQENLPCRPVIPNRLKLKCDEQKITCTSFSTEEEPNLIYRWADETEIGVWASNLLFNPPSHTGENINYRYIINYPLQYLKTNIASDGTILNSTKWSVYLAIDIRDSTQEGYKVVSYRCLGTGIDPSKISPWYSMN